MRIRRFTARDMTEALKLVRETLGPDAVILETNDLEGRDGARQGVMVLAAIDRHPAESFPTDVEFARSQSPIRENPMADSETGKTVEQVRFNQVENRTGESRKITKAINSGALTERVASSRQAEINKTGKASEASSSTSNIQQQRLENQMTPVADDKLDQLIGAVRKERGETVNNHRSGRTVISERGPGQTPEIEVKMQSEIKRLSNRVSYLNRLISSDHFSTIPLPMRELYLDLVEAELDSNLTYAILRESAQDNTNNLITGPRLTPLKKRLLQIMPGGRGVLEQNGSQVIMLLGSPGSGKTTVATAMAARCLRLGRRPGLISLDTFRAGGPTGLEHFARVLEVPFAAVFDQQDLHQAAASALSGADVLIVDTPGMLSGDREAIQMVRGFQKKLVNPQVQLVMAASSKVKDLAEGLTFFSHFEPNALIFSKLDTTKNYGGVLSLSLKAQLPVTYMNWGRQFLEDFRPAAAEQIVDLVFNRNVTAQWGDSEAVHEAGDNRSAKEAV